MENCIICKKDISKVKHTIFDVVMTLRPSWDFDTCEHLGTICFECGLKLHSKAKGCSRSKDELIKINEKYNMRV